MRITELQSVIAELTRKLNTASGNMIIEEEEEEEEEEDAEDEEDDARSRSTSDLENQGKKKTPLRLEVFVNTAPCNECQSDKCPLLLLLERL